LNWYLLALNTAAGRVETFALSRCRSLAGTGQHFARPAGFHAPAFFKDAFGISQADKPWKVRLLFAREVATYIRERVWHARQALRKRRDGALEFRLQTSSRKELTRWILSRMPHVKVLAPRQLRDRVRQRMRQGLARRFSVSGHASQKRMRALRCGSLRAFIQINDRPDFGVLVRVGHFARGAGIVIAQGP
jgi:predicted DNA-binding transcriptional regulator YafY